MGSIFMLQHGIIFKLEIKLLKLERTKETWSGCDYHLELDILTGCPFLLFKLHFPLKHILSNSNVNCLKLSRIQGFHLLQRLKYIKRHCVYGQYSKNFRARQYMKQITKAKSDYTSSDMFTRPVELLLPSGLLRLLMFYILMMKLNTVIIKVRMCGCKICGVSLHCCQCFNFLNHYSIHFLHNQD